MFNFWVPPYFLDRPPRDQVDNNSDSGGSCSPIPPSDDDAVERFVSPILGSNGCSDYAQDCLDDLQETYEENPDELDKKILSMFNGTIEFLEFYVLNIAITFHRDAIALRIINSKASPRILGRCPTFVNEDTPLHIAACFGNLKIIEKLLALDASITAKNSRGLTPLEVAVVFEKFEAIDLLLKPFFEIKKLVTEKISPLHIACLKNDVYLIKHFLEYGCQVNRKVTLHPLYQGYTPLHFAVEFSTKEAVEILLNRGAAVDAVTDKERQTPLQLATDFKKYFNNKNEELLKDQLDIVKLLLRKNCNVNVRMSDGSTSIFDFTDLCLTDMVEEYENFKAFADKLRKDSRVFGLLEMLLENGLEVNAAKDDGTTVLHTLVSRKSWGDYEWELARRLVAGGADVNRTDKDGETPLHFAVCANVDRKVINFLLDDAGAKVNCRDNELTTPLHHAVIYSDAKVVRDLLERGADVCARSKKGRTPLHVAAACQTGLVEVDGGHEISIIVGKCSVDEKKQIFQILMEFGSNVDAADNCKKTPLHLACERGQADTAEDLLRLGANLDVKDEKGFTPLHYATKFLEKDEAFSFLISHVIRRRALSLSICKQNLMYCDKYMNDEFYLYMSQCGEEVRSLKETKIDDDTTLHDLFFKNPNQLAANASKKTFEEFVKNVKKNNQFPIYGDWLKRLYQTGVDRRKQIEKARSTFKDLAKLNLPQSCLDEIFLYCATRDLMNLNNATENITRNSN